MGWTYKTEKEQMIKNSIKDKKKHHNNNINNNNELLYLPKLSFSCAETPKLLFEPFKKYPS